MAQPVKKFKLVGTERANSRPKARPRPPGTAHGDWLGDQRVFTDDLVNNQGKPVGHHSGVGTLVRTGPGDLRTYQSLATFFLNKDAILGEGTILGSAMFSLGTNAPVPRGSIVGGTGPYRTARGDIGLSFPNTYTTNFDFELILD